MLTLGKWLGRKIRRHFLAGLLVTLPIAATIVLLVWIFNTIDSVLQPVVILLFGNPIPGVGFGTTVIFIYLVGLIVSQVAGKRLINYGESLLSKVPIFRWIYISIKQILESFSTPGDTGLLQTVLLEFPRKDIWTIGFITNETLTQNGKTQLNIFIPTSPNPTSGFMQIASEDEVIRTDIPVDNALRMVITAGKIYPKEIADRISEKQERNLSDQ